MKKYIFGNNKHYLEIIHEFYDLHINRNIQLQQYTV